MAKERTVLIINASELTNVLSKRRVQDKGMYEEWPWQIAREIEKRESNK